MSFQPVAKRSLPDEVFAQLVGNIVSGELAPGHTLPSERRLAEVLGVSRPAVREALQRLAQSGLIDVRQGDGTTVRDYRRSAGPDLLARLLMAGGHLDLTVARSIVEARGVLGPQIAALAARRDGPAAADDLDDLVDELAATDDAVELQQYALAFWDRLVDATDNITFRLMFNGLRAAYEPALPTLAELLRGEVERHGAYRALVAALRAADPDRAASAASDLLEPGTTAVISAIDRLLDEEDDR